LSKIRTLNWPRYLSLLAGLGLAGITQAALISRPGGLVYDSAQDLTWLMDANYAGATMDWAGANAWAASLVYAGHDGWRLPTPDPDCPSLDGYDCTGAELGHLFYGDFALGLGGTAGTPISTSHNANFDLFTNIADAGYWTNTALAEDQDYAWTFDYFDGSQLPYAKDVQFLAWAVHDGDLAVPEPATALLLAAGLAGWAGRRRRG